jgi:hypothetical protein
MAIRRILEGPYALYDQMANKRRIWGTRANPAPTSHSPRSNSLRCVTPIHAQYRLLQKAYMEAFERCRLDRRGRPPQTVHIQVLVQVWRVLRKHSSA